MVRARNDGEQFERCGLAGQSFFFAVAFLSILSENVLLSHIGSRMAAVLVYGSRQRFSTSANPSQGGTFEEDFAR